ncbi:hypothetical protein ABZX30_15405 [Streptomyces sp. NPDC004542]|uniref:hypothetical protein n=1 Tax=Streptomyces sp. NPDC004542 TaxID=3154281 RepID=UPI0033A7E3E4
MATTSPGTTRAPQPLRRDRITPRDTAPHGCTEPRAARPPGLRRHGIAPRPPAATEDPAARPRVLAHRAAGAFLRRAAGPSPTATPTPRPRVLPRPHRGDAR